MVQKDLRLVDKPPERGGVDDPVPVALVFRACGRWCFIEKPPPTFCRVAGVRSKVTILNQNDRYRL